MTDDSEEVRAILGDIRARLAKMRETGREPAPEPEPEYSEEELARFREGLVQQLGIAASMAKAEGPVAETLPREEALATPEEGAKAEEAGARGEPEPAVSPPPACGEANEARASEAEPVGVSRATDASTGPPDRLPRDSPDRPHNGDGPRKPPPLPDTCYIPASRLRPPRRGRDAAPPPLTCEMRRKFEGIRAYSYFEFAWQTCLYWRCRSQRRCAGGPRGTCRRTGGVPLCRFGHVEGVGEGPPGNSG